MKQTLSRKDSFFIGSMLFGILFGAGNLIFPVHMGQEAGANIWSANLGFLLTAIGFPFLSIMAIGLSGGKGVFHLASRVAKPFAYFFTIALYLVIGPFFAMPRLATTSFEIAFAPFLSEGMKTPALAIYSVIFFGLAYLLSKKPGKLIDIIGKYINPAFLLVLGVVLLFVIINPLGAVKTAVVGQAYQSAPFLKGFIEGYNTLDVLAGLAFGIVVITALKQKGITQPKSLAIEMTKSGLIAMGLMGLIYTLLAYAGTTSLGGFDMSENGGIALGQITAHYLGAFGSIMLALIVFLGCFKTCIGLATACSETFNELFPSKPYGFYLMIFSILPAIIANVGLTQIIQLSLPVLMFIYPLAIVLMLLGIASAWLPLSQKVYRSVIVFTLLAAIVDGLNATPALIHDLAPVQGVITFAAKVLPFFELGMGWILPALVGLVVGIIWQQFGRETITAYR
ncbi:branched-chain amino acid transport system II carrier protein [Streptococcus jiangjianxini]|uniref:branched-chain amino acid transport system II carrier protein n=1 Tax=Streptococcus jiangjianxini TaxID=3161189 RepID=UPI0032EBFEDA